MLKLPPAKLSDADARALFAMLDDDGGFAGPWCAVPEEAVGDGAPNATSPS